jgi:hypothetical protein
MFEQIGDVISLKVNTFSSDAQGEEAFHCVTYAAIASGFPLGFIGKEAYDSK